MISLLTFGGMDLRDDAGCELESVLRGPKQLALLAYLATATPRGFHRRDTLLALFWPELDQDRARRSLRQTLYQLRHTFGTGEAIQNRGEEIALAAGALWCDAAAFEDHLDEGRLEKALELYRGEFLKGFHVSGCADLERWLEETRARLRQRAVTAARQLSDQYASTGDGAEAVRWAEWVMVLIPTDEGAFHRLAVLLDQLGDRSNALQAYEELATRLRKEYEVEPSPETAALIEKIRARKEANGLPVQQRIIQPEHVGQSQQDVGQISPTDGAKVRAARNGRRLRVAWVAVAITVLVGGFAIVRNGRYDSTHVLVAVLENRTGDSTLDPFGSMAADWVTRGLIETEIVTAVAPHVTLRYKPISLADSVTSEIPPAVEALAAANGAATVVWGAYYKEGDSLRVEAAVGGIGTDAPIRVLDPVTADMANAVATLEVVRQRALQALARRVNPRLGLWIRQERKPPSYEAYEEYLQGFEHTYVGHPLRSLARGRMHYDRAVSIDSSFTAAMLAAAFAAPDSITDSLLQLAHRRNGPLGVIDSATAQWIQASLGGDVMAQYYAVRRLSELLPGDAFVQYARVRITQTIGRYRESVEVLEQIDPSGPAFGNYWDLLTKAHHRLGNHEEELTAARQGVEQYPGNNIFLETEARALAALGRLDELMTLLDREAVGLATGEDLSYDLMNETGLELLVHGHVAAAEDLFTKALDLYSRLPQEFADLWNLRTGRFLALYHTRQWELAESLLDPVSDTAGARGDRELILATDWGYLGLLAASTGAVETATEFSQQLATIDIPNAFSYRAMIAARLGQREQALQLLEEAIARGEGRGWLHTSESEFESIKDHPTYKELMSPTG